MDTHFPSKKLLIEQVMGSYRQGRWPYRDLKGMRTTPHPPP